MQNEISSLLKREADAIMNIPADESYAATIELIHKHVHKLGGKVIVSGMGKAGQIALSIATTFSSTGTPAVWMHPADAQHGDLGVMQVNDIMLLISNSGKTREILELVYLAKNLYPNTPVIVITGGKDSELAKLSDVCLYTGGPEELCILGLSPTISTTVMSVIGDLLVVLMMKKIGFTIEDYARRHHGGYLGEQSRLRSSK